MIKYNIVTCCYDKILVKVAAYVIPGQMCVWCGVYCLLRSIHPPKLFVRMLVHNKHLQAIMFTCVRPSVKSGIIH